MIAAFGIISQPVLKAYAKCEIIQSIEEDASTDSNSDQESPNASQISTLEAVAPTAQIHLTPLDFVLVEQANVEQPKQNAVSNLVVQLPEKLLKVLFNIIIAPNAP